MGEHREPDGEVDRKHDQVLMGELVDSSTMITAKTIEARPRGPNQPMKPRVGSRLSVPSIAIATGTDTHNGQAEDRVEDEVPAQLAERGPEQDRREDDEGDAR